MKLVNKVTDQCFLASLNDSNAHLAVFLNKILPLFQMMTNANLILVCHILNASTRLVLTNAIVSLVTGRMEGFAKVCDMLKSFFKLINKNKLLFKEE